MSIFRRITNLFSRAKVDREIKRELAAHIEMRGEDNQARGMSAQEARRDALLRFGNPAAIQERTAEADAALWLESLWSDLCYAGRQLRKNPGFAFTAIVVLALGVGASVAIFAFVDAVLIKPLPYRDPARLMALYESTPSGPHFHLSYLDYLDWKKQNRSFAALEAYDNTTLVLGAASGVMQVDGASVSDGFFRALGVQPTLGRDFVTGEDGQSAPRTAMLSYAAWQKRYGGATGVLGATVNLDNNTYTIVGVLPKGFHFAPVEDAEFWTTLHRSMKEDRGEHGLSAIARLRDGVTIEAARGELKVIQGEIARRYPDADDGRGATVAPLTDAIVGNFRPILLVLLAGAALLLVIACVNVASLLLVRAESRQREMALRGALGASRARLMRQLVTEGAALASLGCVLGLGASVWAMRLLMRLVPMEMRKGMPYLDGLGNGWGLNAHEMLFAAALAVLAVTVFSVAPMARLRMGRFSEGMAEGGRGAAGRTWRRLGANLVVLELTTAMVLLVGAGLLAKSLYRLLHTETGIEAKHVAVVRVTAAEAGYGSPARIVALARQISERVKQLPGVERVSVAHSLPVGNRGGNTAFDIVGRPRHGDPFEANQRQVDAEYFRTLGARLLQGRYFRADEDLSKPRVAIVNAALAAKYFPGEDALGKRLQFDPALEIVGVVADVKEGPLDEAMRPAIYTPLAQGSEWGSVVMARSTGDPAALLTEMTEAIHGVDRGLLVAGAQTLQDRIAESQASYLHRASAALVGGFAGLALILSVVGLYGVIAYSVAQRTREIGVRMALGAQRGTVAGMVLREAGWLAVIGIGLGMASAVGAASLMRSLLFGVSSWDVSTLLAVGGVLAMAALLASWLPARRAASVNPVEALRAE